MKITGKHPLCGSFSLGRLARFSLSLLLVLAATSLAASGKQIVRGGVPEAAARLTPLGKLDPAKRLNLAIGLPLRDPAGLAKLIQDQYDPTSPRYHQWVTPAESAAKFCATEADYQAVIDWATAHHLNVTAKYSNRVVLDVEGSVADIEQALNVSLKIYNHPTEARTFYAANTEPSLDLAVPILTIEGLDSYSLPHPNSIVKPIPASTGATPSGTSVAPNAGSGPGGLYGGCDFRAAYAPGVTQTGIGQNVGLLEFDGYYPVDIANYVTYFSLPSVPLINVAVDGGIVGPPGGGDGEVSLDIEMVIAMAPGVSAIYVYEAPNASPWIDIIGRIQTDNLCKQVSCSWSGGGPDAAAENLFQLMASQGQSFFNATGDGDAFTGAIPFPSESPNITEVGGTTLTTSGACGVYVSETAWNWGGGTGTSGGVSPTYSTPFWQQGINMVANQGSTTKRNVPDVALTADNIYVKYNNGGAGNFGGTSCAAPLWAAYTALVNATAANYNRSPIGFLNPALYALAKGPTYTANFHDVTTGNNFSPSSPALFSAVAGYDLCTGWGSPSGDALLNYLAGVAPIVPNGGFETGDFSFWTPGGNTGGTFVSGGGHSGAHSAAFGAVGSTGYIYQYVATVPGQTYVLSFWLQSGGTTNNSFSAYINGYVLNLVNFAPFGWTQYQYTFTATDISSFLYFEGRNDPSYTHLDDVTVTPLPGNTGVVTGVPKNGSFEAGNFSAWTQSGNLGFTSVGSYIPQVHSGTYAAYFGPVASLGYLTQTIPTVPGQTYLLSFWLKNGSGTPTNEFKLSWDGGVLADYVNIGGFDWELWTWTVTATSANTVLQFGFQNDADYFYLDAVSLTPLAGTLLGQAAYVRSGVGGEPWGINDNRTAMDRVFGAGNWNDLQYETIDPAALFSPAVHFIFMEGSDANANALNTFITANMGTMQSWVSNGGSLFINAAPNEGGNINLGFGVTLNFNLSYTTASFGGTAALPLNPIFNGPFQPVGTAWTGSYFGHATITGAGVTPLIIDTSTSATILGEMNVGLGHVLFGGMTQPTFHTPQPQAQNLRANILAYGNTTPQGTFDDLPGNFESVPNGYRGVNWNNFNCLNAVTYYGNPSGYGAGVVSPNNVAYNSGGDPASLTSPTPFNFFSAEMTAAWNDNLILEAKGYVNGVLTYDQTYALSATAPTLITFNYLGVTEVDLITSGGTPHPGYGGFSATQFAMDDVTIVTSPGTAQAGVDHFAWSAVGTPQHVNAPIPVSITAQAADNSTATAFSTPVALTGWTGTGSLIEGFESGVWPSGSWVPDFGTPGIIGGAYAHNGSYGLSDPEWAYRTDVSLGNGGDVLSAWVRPGSGRAYLGFGASAGGCWSVVAAPNTSQLVIMQNAGFGYTDKAFVTQSWTAGHWYRLEVQFVSSKTVRANLYDSDGTTLLNTLTYTGVTGLPGGVAMRSFAGFSLDTITGGPMAQVPIIANVSGNFVSGVWNGSITVLVPEPATNMVLFANNGIGGPAGSSTPFKVLLVPPQFTSIAKIPGGVNLTWGTYPGALYQLQYRTNLLQPDWINLGSYTAVGSTLTIPDLPGPDPVRFYRVGLEP
jgi:hypothetical protein